MPRRGGSQRGAARGADGRRRQLRRGHAGGAGRFVVRGEGPRGHGAALRAEEPHGRAHRRRAGAWLVRAGITPRRLREVPAAATSSHLRRLHRSCPARRR
jgi:hypothetical protein